jgi:nucleoside-diphosphate-sugar epimerase
MDAETTCGLMVDRLQCPQPFQVTAAGVWSNLSVLLRASIRGHVPVTESTRVVVFGATGFVGTEVAKALRDRGVTVCPMTTPRLPPVRADQAEDFLQHFNDEIKDLSRHLFEADCVVNSAGVAEATSTDEGSLIAANGLVPGYLATAAFIAGVPRYIQVSSAAVQGRTHVLDSSANVAPFSPYSRSKALGALLARKAHPGTVEYRPPGVHGADRRVSQMTARIARSRLSSVARPGSSPTPQALLKNVADAIAFLATSQMPPPAIVAHPSEGLTTAGVLMLLGRRQPLEIPRALAKLLVMIGMACGRVAPAVAANTRRIEMLWFGQSQAPSWLTDAGWKPPVGQEAWRELGRLLAERSSRRDEPCA